MRKRKNQALRNLKIRQCENDAGAKQNKMHRVQL